MKKISLLLTGILLAICTINTAQTYTPGSLTFKFTPVSHNGYSGTKNALAVWIQTDSNDFVKTKIRYVGGGTDDHLPIWGANAGCSNPYSVTSSSCNTTDAVTGATLSSFSAKTVVWDGKNVNGTSNGTTVADGTYKVTIEECWDHGSSGRTTISYSFIKGPNTQHLTPANSAHFTNVSLDWVPEVTPLATTISTTNDSFGNCNGTATVTVTGGQSPYTYAWSTMPVQSVATATGLCAGTYFVTVTDSTGEKIVDTAVVNPTGTALICSTTTTNDTYGNCNGTATANPSGGQSPYTYKWNTMPSQSSKTATGLCAGTYSVTVTDAKSNKIVASAKVNATGTALTSSATSTNASAGNCNGTATVVASGGLSPYSFKWNTTPVQTAATATGLCPGTYTVTVTDAASNTDTSTATVISVVAIDEISSDPSIKIYPNPSDGTFSVQFKKANAIKVENTLGEILYEEILKEGSTAINLDLSTFPNGNYSISVINEGEVSKHKIVIQK